MSQIKVRIIIAVAITSLSLFVATAFAQQNTREIFERARMLDESNQNLSEAIKLYSQVVNQANEQRALAARAQLRIGILYERLGRKAEAQRAFQTVVNQYSDQTETARVARAKLPPSARGPKAKAAAANGAASNALTVRQLWAGQTVDIEGGVSADGRYLSYTDWSNGDLAVHDFASGKDVRLTGKRSWETPEYADFSAISPDAKQIAYAWFDGTRYQLRLISTDGSESRVLFQDPNVINFHPSAWSPDKKFVLTVFYLQDHTNQIALVSTSDGAVRKLKTLDWRVPNKMSFSPDGQWIAYDLQSREESQDHDIYLLSVDGKREEHLVNYPADNLYPFWTADGKRIVFVSDRGSGLGLWAARVDNGKADGEPELIKPELGHMYPLGLTLKGSYYYGLFNGGDDVYLAKVDRVSGKFISAPTSAARRFLGFNSTPDFSPDGERLAYISTRHPNPALVAGAKVLVIRLVKTGEERVLPMQIGLGFELKWSPDGRSLLVTGRDLKRQFGLYSVDAQSGAVTLLVERIATCNVGCSPKGWFPDGKSIYFVRWLAPTNGGKTVIRLVRRNLESGAEEDLLRYDEGTYSFLTLSPDGKYFAGWRPDRSAKTIALVLIPVNGGQPKEITRLKDDALNEPTGTPTGIAWSPNSRYLFYGRRAASDKTEVWRVSTAGDQPQSLGVVNGRIYDLVLHPNGDRLAFSTHSYRPEVWVMENFLSRPKSISHR